MTNLTLPIDMIISVDLNNQPRLLSRDSFNRFLIVGKSANKRGTLTGVYTSPAGVKEDYGVEAPEYKIAQKYFQQIPRPKDVMIATVGSAPTAEPSYLRLASPLSTGGVIGELS